MISETECAWYSFNINPVNKYAGKLLFAGVQCDKIYNRNQWYIIKYIHGDKNI